ncbi:condensation domain-containing protein [Streptomyces sp. NPDC049813]|uniref:condensation domain-containing protein n=1 Tax=Streptomyces sp. NPDC049813 TaxID=3365597 RepID=UPI00379903D6
MARQSRRRARIRAGRSPATSPRVPPPLVPVPAQQRAVLLDAQGDRHSGRHVEQVWWSWHGALDLERFTAAWHSVADRESVLRAAFEGEPLPRVVFSAQARVEVVRHRAGTVDWDDLLAADRLRGFDVTRPCPLRVTVVEGPVSSRVLLTFHHGLLDAWSVFVLLDEFGRAYLADGTLPGGERRPDLRDWTRWRTEQDTAAAREFFGRTLPAGPAAVLPGRPGPRPAHGGCGRAETRLSTQQADRLRQWAAGQALPESSVLHAVWALLLYRAADVSGAAAVRFGVTVSGRGIALDAAERLVGPVRTCLPAAVRVDPGDPVAHLFATLRDQALDLAAYEWLSTAQISEWSEAADAVLPDSVVSVEAGARPRPDLRAALAEAGVRFGAPHSTGAHTLLSVALLARHARDGSLTLAALHDRSRITDDDARLLLAQCCRLLRRLPSLGGTETVAEVLAVLGADPAPRVGPPPGG